MSRRVKMNTPNLKIATISSAGSLIASFLDARAHLADLLKAGQDFDNIEIVRADRLVSETFKALLNAEFSESEHIRERADFLIDEIVSSSEGNTLLARMAESLRSDISAL